MHRFVAATAALALLAACSKKEEPVEAESAEDFAARVGGAGADGAVGGETVAQAGTRGNASALPAPAGSVEDVPPVPPMKQLGAAQAIPERFTGVWDFGDGTCDRQSDLRLNVGSRRIQFYASTGQVNGFEQVNADTIVVNLDMTGEGETWQDRMRLSLENGGRVLVTQDQTGYGEEQPLRRKRCAS